MELDGGDGGVVGEGAGAGEGGERIECTADDLAHGWGTFDNIAEPAGGELFAGLAALFDHAVAVEQEAITRGEFEGLGFIREVGVDADGDTGSAGGEFGAVAVGGEAHPVSVPGIDVGEHAGGVDDAEPEGDEASGTRAFGDETVDLAHGVSGSGAGLDLGVEAGLGHGHEEGGSDAVPRDIAEEDSDAVVVDGDDIEEVACDEETGAHFHVVGGEAVAAVGLGEDGLLCFACGGELFVEGSLSAFEVKALEVGGSKPVGASDGLAEACGVGSNGRFLSASIEVDEALDGFAEEDRGAEGGVDAEFGDALAVVSRGGVLCGEDGDDAGGGLRDERAAESELGGVVWVQAHGGDDFDVAGDGGVDAFEDRAASVSAAAEGGLQGGECEGVDIACGVEFGDALGEEAKATVGGIAQVARADALDTEIAAGGIVNGGGGACTGVGGSVGAGVMTGDDAEGPWADAEEVAGGEVGGLGGFEFDAVEVGAADGTVVEHVPAAETADDGGVSAGDAFVEETDVGTGGTTDGGGVIGCDDKGTGVRAGQGLKGDGVGFGVHR